MRIYLAGTSVSNPPDEPKLQELFKRGHKLHSYYHIPVLEKKWYQMNVKNKVDLFLDSGAFSAWTQGTHINIDEYIAFIKENKDSINIYANLDVISIDGSRPNEDTAAATYRNQKIMERHGLSPIPCFHFGEPFNYLYYYVENYEYLALGVAGIKGQQLIPWLNECFSNYICDKDGMPRIKVHGFAITSVPIMIKYPWYSVDSTSWVVTSRMGGLFIPRFNDGKYVYDEQSHKVMVSSRSPGMKEKGKHIDNVPQKERDVYLNYIHACGYTLGKSEFQKVSQTYILREHERWSDSKPKEKDARRMLERIIEPGLSNTYQLRDELNILYFLNLEASRPSWPWAFKVETTPQGFGLNDE